MLGLEHGHEVCENACFFKPWEEELFLLPFMIVLDKAADNRSRVRNQFRLEISLPIDLVDEVIIDEEHAIQHAVLAHEILRWSNVLRLLVLLLCVLLLFVLGEGGTGAHNESCADLARRIKKAPAIRIRACLH